ncbi:hypothetical protein [Massilia sp. METH4]|uniref:hypothetical protein n=1 Tax=Massilia sp. METH4 TaxID=3123041 RepID=UPI0030D3971A
MTSKRTIAATTFAMLSTTALADITIDPQVGAANVYLKWDAREGTGFMLAVTALGGQDALGNRAYISVDADSTIDFSISDGAVPGDAFAITLDGVLLTPTSGNTGPETRGPFATSFYSAFYDDIALSAGNHTFELFLTDSCCEIGGTWATWSPAAAIPEPSIGVMLAAGLGFTAFAALRNGRGRKHPG